MASLPAFRYLLFTHLYRHPLLPSILHRKLSIPFPHSRLSSPPKLRAIPRDNCNNHTLVLKTDERVLGSGTLNPSNPPVTNSSTIAAIVTSLGGPPAAVGIVRLSRPSAVSIVGRLFRSLKKKKKKRIKDDTSEWRPKSHVVEYGVVSDSRGNVIDEI